jgi:hypothetical protein
VFDLLKCVFWCWYERLDVLRSQSHGLVELGDLIEFSVNHTFLGLQQGVEFVHDGIDGVASDGDEGFALLGLDTRATEVPLGLLDIASDKLSMMDAIQVTWDNILYFLVQELFQPRALGVLIAEEFFREAALHWALEDIVFKWGRPALHAYGVLTARDLDGKTVSEREAADADWAVQVHL